MALKELFIICAMITCVESPQLLAFVSESFIFVDERGAPLGLDKRRQSRHFTPDCPITRDVIRWYATQYGTSEVSQREMCPEESDGEGGECFRYCDETVVAWLEDANRPSCIAEL